MKHPPLKRVAISDSIISSAVAINDDMTFLSDVNLTDSEKISIIQDRITIQEVKLRGLKQQAAIGRCLDIIKELRQYQSLLNNELSIIDHLKALCDPLPASAEELADTLPL